jgi:hypothetical protein
MQGFEYLTFIQGPPCESLHKLTGEALYLSRLADAQAVRDTVLVLQPQ